MFRLLGFEYLKRDEFVHVKPQRNEGPLADVNTSENVEYAAIPVAAPVATSSVAEQPAAYNANANQTQEYMSKMQSDAPACNVCGHITLRSGNCYKCLNCGNSMGCS